MKVERYCKPVVIDPTAEVRLTEMGDIAEVMFSRVDRPSDCSILKLDKDRYLNKITGEVCEFQHITNRSQDIETVAKSLKRLRGLLNANITDVSRCRWLTFTYADNMTDPNKLRYDNENCIKRLRNIFGNFEYITVAEPQARGAWHLHSVFIFEDTAPFMPNDVVAQCWKKGFVTVKQLDCVDNVGAYLTAYLGDMELSEANECGIAVSNSSIKELEYTDENGNRKSKKYVKGARLYLYPP